MQQTERPRPQSALAQTTPKGHMSVKSSLYAIGNAKWISQRLVQDHMDAHYKKLLNAKPAIDTKIPKSSITGVKARDSWKRKTGSYPAPIGKSRPASVTVSRATSHMGDNGSTGREDFIDELQSVLSLEDFAENPALAEEFEKRKRSAPTPAWSPSTALPLTASVIGSTARARSSLTHYGLGGSGIIYKTGRHRQIVGDYVDRFADKFKGGDEFQPRLLKKKAQSWLAASKHYVPPPQFRVRSAVAVEQTSTPTTQPQTSSKPPFPTKQDSISNKQTTPRKPEPVTQKLSSANSELASLPEKPSSEQTTEEAFAITAFDRLNDEGCVKFIANVTQDIISRGVFTDKAIENIIQEHYFKNKGKFSERKLQLAISSLREDFGLNETGHVEKDAFIAVQEQYSFTSPSYHPRTLTTDSVSSKEHAMTPTSVASTLIDPLSPSKTAIEAAHHDDELNKTVDELIAKINELESRPSENHHETLPNKEDASVKETEEPTAATTTTTKPEITMDKIDETKQENNETGDYEEDFE